MVWRKTCEVVQAVVDFIWSARARDELVVDAQGQPITIGQVRALIGREVAARGLETPHGTIFAQGRDAGMPQMPRATTWRSCGWAEVLVFDIFPRDIWAVATTTT